MAASTAAATAANDADSDEEEEGDDDQDDDVHSSHLSLQSMQFDYSEKCGDDLRCARCRFVLEEPVIQSSCGERWHNNCYKQTMYEQTCLGVWGTLWGIVLQRAVITACSPVYCN